MSQIRFLGIAREGQRAIDTLDFPVQTPGLELVYGTLEYRVRLLGTEPFCLQRFVRARGRFIEPIGRVVGQCVEDQPIRLEFELLTVHSILDPRLPRIARHHEDEERFLRIGWKGGNGR